LVQFQPTPRGWSTRHSQHMANQRSIGLNFVCVKIAPRK
jgi:hypothetical protein